MPTGSSDIIYDWNQVDKRGPLTSKSIKLLDETFRDGIQSPSVIDPNINDKIKLIHIMDELGIDTADIGLPAASSRIYMDVLNLAQEIVRSNLTIKPACAARTTVSDIEPIVEISQKTGVAIEVLTFIGSSPIRAYAEEWDIDRLLRLTREAVTFARSHGLPVTFVTEDTSRSKPSTLDPLFRAAIECGAYRICLCDTVGHATPDGVMALIKFTQNIISGSGRDIAIDWHGHDDRGFGLINSLYAIEAGVDRVHGTALGIGERCGNSAMELILLNLKLLDVIDNDLSKLLLYCKVAERATRHQIPNNYPLVGRDAFRTATGVHAAAIIKAQNKGDTDLADRIYSGVPASLIGREQAIEIGHVSGESNVICWLEERHYTPEPALVARLLAAAKRSMRILTDEEITEIINNYAKSKGQSRRDLQS